MENIKYHYDVIQGSDEWYELRRGILTASTLTKCMPPISVDVDNVKVGNITKRTEEKIRGFAYQLAAERVFGFHEGGFQSFAMQRGHVEEVYAKDLYSKNYEQVKDCGFIENETLGFKIGCSPDGLIGVKKGVEVKSRCMKLQAQTLIERKIPDDAMLQVQASMFISGLKEWDYISYGNGMPLCVIPVQPIEEYFDQIEMAAIVFEALVCDFVELLKERMKGLPIAERIDYDALYGDISPSEPAKDYIMAG